MATKDFDFSKALIGATQHWVINYHSDVTILTHCPWEMWRLGWVENFMGTLFSISLLSIEGYFWKSMANLLDAHSLPNHCRYNRNSDMYSNLFESYLSYRLISWVLPGKSLPCECNIIDPLMKVSIGSGNGLVPSGNKPLPGPMLTPIHDTICHCYSLGHNWLTHLPLDKIAAISQTTFSNAFSWIKMLEL